MAKKFFDFGNKSRFGTSYFEGALISSEIQNGKMNMTIMQRILSRTAIMIACVGGPITTEAITSNVVFNNFSFTPKTVTIHVGDTVVWTNAGGSHTVTGDGADPICGTGTVPVSCSHTFAEAGTFAYHCIPHRSLGMVGSVVVLPASVPP